MNKMILTKFICKQKIWVNQIWIFRNQMREDAGIKYFNDPNVFSKCSNIMDDVYENIDD